MWIFLFEQKNIRNKHPESLVTEMCFLADHLVMVLKEVLPAVEKYKTTTPQKMGGFSISAGAGLLPPSPQLPHP